MKAYVIKNEEGKYLTETFDWADDLYFAMTYDETHLLSDKREHWQEITIAEGDLQKESEVLRKALEFACDELDTWHRSCDNRPDYFIQQAKEQRDE